MTGDPYRELAVVCRRRKLRLMLCGDRDHHNHAGIETKLVMLEIRRGPELLVRVSLQDHTLDTAAVSALNALKKAGKR